MAVVASTLSCSCELPSGPSPSAGSQTHIPVLLRTMHPFTQTYSLYLPLNATCTDILSRISGMLRLPSRSASLLRLWTTSGQRLSPDDDLRHLCSTSASTIDFLSLEVRLTTLGGKGGFGSMLRAQGGRMSSRKGQEENTDSCRDLNGRRLSTVKDAKALAAYLASAPQREAALSKAQSEKYAKLEKMLGRKPRNEVDFQEAAERLDDAGGQLVDGDDQTPLNVIPVKGKESSSSGVQSTNAKRRERLDDDGFIEENKRAVDKAKSAVAIAMAKKKARAKAAATDNKTNTVPAAAL